MRSARTSLLLPTLLLSLLAGSAGAGPQDTRVGETRQVYDIKGTVLRAEPSPTGAPLATLSAKTYVKVLEVKLPWAKVEATRVPGAAPVSGWLRAYQALEPSALAATPPPAHVDARGAAGVSAREASAAGRQFSADTERDFRRQRVDLTAAYTQVDALEQATSTMDASESIGFIMDGWIGRRGCDYVLPARLPPSPDPTPAAASGGGGGRRNPLGGALGGLLKEGAKHLGASEKLVDGLYKFASPIVQARAEQLKKKFTPDQEYYLGRAVAAQAIAKYGVEPNQALRRYVRSVGDAMVRVSSRVGPSYGGYHFEVLNSDEVNGVSGPGGFVLVTRGAVLACRTEDELAGILAHELAHITRQHAEQILRGGGRWQGAMKGFLGGVAAVTGVDDSRLGAQMVGLFTEAVGEMARTSVDHSYGPALENDADLEGSMLLHDVFYDWWALRNVLAGLAATGHAHGGATHASPQQRAAQLDPRLAPLGAFTPRDTMAQDRLQRFEASIGRAPMPVGPR